MDSVQLEKIKGNFRRHNIDVSYFTDVKSLCKQVLDVIPSTCSIGVGNSATLQKIGIVEQLDKRGNKVLDKTKASTKAEINDIKRRALLSDWYLSGSNAISVDGNIVNIDHSGNRVAALMYGPSHVIIVVGSNKITNTLDEAISRAKNTASPRNAKRAGYNPPCVALNKCVDCHSSERVCNYLTVIQGQYVKDRMKVYIIDEALGF